MASDSSPTHGAVGKIQGSHRRGRAAWCGTAQQWLQGLSLPVAEPLYWIESLTPTCCVQGVYSIGSTGPTPGVIPVNPCPCTYLMPTPLFAEFTVLAGSCDDIDGAIVPLIGDSAPCAALPNDAILATSPSFLFCSQLSRLVWTCPIPSFVQYSLWLVPADCGPGLIIQLVNPAAPAPCTPFIIETTFVTDNPPCCAAFVRVRIHP